MSNLCPQCGSKSVIYFQTTDLNQKIDEAVFNYYQCTQCQLIFLDPIPENLAGYYVGDYRAYRIPHSLGELEKQEKTLHWRVEFVEKFKNGGKLLEIGSSYGAFAYGAHQAGFDVEVIEMDKNCCDFINSTTTITATNTTDIVGTMSARDKMYDVIAIWHGIEHIPDSWAVLRQCVRQLAPQGVLLVATPNPDSIQFRLFKKYWMHLDAPRHVELIPQATLTSFLENLNMQMTFITTTDPDGLLLSRLGWYNSTLKLFGAGSEKNVIRKIVSKILLGVVSPVERWSKRGAAYTAVYRKK